MKFSVITVVYNGVDTIERTIQSVINQDIADMEYIIIDGGSTDGTIEILKKYSRNISWWESEKDDGIYDAMNKGLKKATGEIIAFINSDDWYETNALKTVSQYFQDKNKKIIYGIVNKIVDGKKEGYIGIYQQNDIEAIHITNLYCHQGMFIRKSVFEEIGDFDTRFRVCADYEWTLRAHNSGIYVSFIPEIVANFTIGGYSTITTAYNEVYEIIANGLGEHDCYDAYVEKLKLKTQKRKAIDYLLENNIASFSEIIFSKMDYYIWGMGKIGEECYRILSKLGMNIEKFLDKSPSDTKLHGIDSISSKEFLLHIGDLVISHKNNDVVIFIATDNYEDEIRNEIRHSVSDEELNKIKILSYRELKDWAFEKYKAKCN